MHKFLWGIRTLYEEEHWGEDGRLEVTWFYESRIVKEFTTYFNINSVKDFYMKREFS